MKKSVSGNDCTEDFVITFVNSYITICVLLNLYEIIQTLFLFVMLLHVKNFINA